MKKISLFILVSLASCAVQAQSQTLQERLGYSRDAKLLILHADDLGMAHSQNAASIKAFEMGPVNSGSIMVPCPWFPEIAAYARANPTIDLGLHLTLTSEWKYLKWAPILPAREVPGLVNKEGFLFSSVDSLRMNGKPGEVEMELRAQIEKALQFGIDVTHLDSHMGALFSNADYLKVLIKLGREYKIPVLLSKDGVRSTFNADLKDMLNEKDVLMDGVFTAMPADFSNGMENYYAKVFSTLKPGVNIILMHLAYDDREMQAATIDHPDWGAAWRQADYDFFTSDKCRKMLADQNIKLVTWREIRDRWVR